MTTESTKMTTEYNVILEPRGNEYSIKSAPVTTVRSIIEQIKCINDALVSPENYHILWYYDSNGIECYPRLVNLDTEVHMPSKSDNLHLYCGIKYVIDLDIDITCDKIYSDNGEFNDKNLIKTTIKLPNIIESQDQLIQSIADSLDCDPKSILKIYEEDSLVDITKIRIGSKWVDPVQYMTVQVDKKVIIEFYTILPDRLNNISV
jgi:hypothetical protein